MQTLAARLDDACIWVSPGCADSVVVDFAASELQRYLKKMTDITVSIKATSSRPHCDLVIRLALDRQADLQADAFKIAVTPDLIQLTSSSPRGVLYAVYSLLEELGCRWVHPGEGEEIVPRVSALRLVTGERTETPHIEHRGLALYGLYKDTVELGRQLIDWMAKNRLNLLLTSWDRPDPTDTQTMFWPQVADTLLAEVKRRGILIDMSEHSTQYFFPRSLFEEHPDWFSLLDGKRWAGQMCYSNAEGVEYFGKRLAEFAAEHPEIDILGAWPLDGGGYCECEGCQDPDTVFKATARMAEMVHQVRPDLIVEHLAYRPQSLSVPKVDIPEYMSVLLCNRTGELARDWVEAMKGKSGAYYFEYKMADQYHWATNVWLRTHYAAEITRTAVDIGFRGVVPLFLPMKTWWQSSFNIYVYARTCWNLELDVHTVLGDDCRTYFGDLAQPVHSMLNTILESMQDPAFVEDRGEFGGLDPLRSDKAAVAHAREVGEQLLTRLSALEETTTDPTLLRRLQRIWVYVTYFNLFYAFRAEEETAARQRALDALSDFATQYADDAIGVCTTSEFVRWRLRP